MRCLRDPICPTCPSLSASSSRMRGRGRIQRPRPHILEEERQRRRVENGFSVQPAGRRAAARAPGSDVPCRG
eukprot:3228728-Pyramimonas_sp.AAC.1